MAFARTETTILNHRKFLGLDPAAIGLWTLGNAYCWDQLTDGFIPDAQLPRLLSWVRLQIVKRLASALLTHGLWERGQGGYRVHDWLDHNPPASRVIADREAAKDRANKSRRDRGALARTPARIPARTQNVRNTCEERAAADVDVRSKSKTNPLTPFSRIADSNPRAKGSNPRAVGTNPRADDPDDPFDTTPKDADRTDPAHLRFNIPD